MSRRVVIGSLLLLIASASYVEAIAAQLQLTWTDNSTNEDGFTIERSPGTTGTFAHIGVTGVDVTSYTDSGLPDATPYCYRVRAYNSAGHSDYSNVACSTTPQTLGLAVVRTGTGDGTVTSSPAGITCGTSCSGSFPSGTAVTLTATPAAGSTFIGWSGGGCSGMGSCTATLTAATTVTSTFDAPTLALTVNQMGGGGGTVTSTSGTAVIFPAAPATGASVEVPTFALTVTHAGAGSGSVTSTPAGISCGENCSASFPSGTAVTLTATPAPGSTFIGWSDGGCSDAGLCTITMKAGTAVTAWFKRQDPPAAPGDLSLSKPEAAN